MASTQRAETHSKSISGSNLVSHVFFSIVVSARCSKLLDSLEFGILARWLSYTGNTAHAISLAIFE